MKTREYSFKRKTWVWCLAAGMMLFALQAGLVPKEAGAVMFGTYASAETESQSMRTPSGTYYLTNGQTSSTATVGPSQTTGDYATANASLSNPNSLSLTFNGNGTIYSNNNYNGTAGGRATMYDTLTFGNLPSGTVSGILADITMSLASNIYDAGGNVTGFADLSVFAPNVYSGDISIFNYFGCPNTYCPNADSANYTLQSLNLASNGISVGSPGVVFTIPVTSGDLVNNQFSYIADINAYVTGPHTQVEPTFFIDPSISLTNLAPGITVTSASGASYLGASPPISPTPEASSLVLFATGLGMLGGWVSRKRKNGKPGALRGQRCFSS